MRRNLFTLIIFLTFLTLFETYVYYGIRSFCKSLSLKKQKIIKVIYFILLIISTLSVFVIVLFGTCIKINVLNFFIAAVFINFMSKLFFTIFLVIDDIRRLGLIIKKWLLPSKYQKRNSSNKNHISRSDFLTKMGLTVAAIPALSLPFGLK